MNGIAVQWGGVFTTEREKKNMARMNARLE